MFLFPLRRGGGVLTYRFLLLLVNDNISIIISKHHLVADDIKFIDKTSFRGAINNSKKIYTIFVNGVSNRTSLHIGKCFL